MAAAVIVWALVAAGVALLWLSVLGVLWGATPLDRLHFAAPAATIAPALLALAAIVHDAGVAAAVKPAMVAAVMVAGAPVLTHAVANAADPGRDR
ncbi:MAG TPA: monovalent cation/H(+) antiporter subunit G [Gaiellales bacterium]|jgi:multisubunit Na+/H+ antiporter MnhG subunit|nr:monovalent cation/H(+) antiporter subunit G [Gaiellales bacterium]